MAGGGALLAAAAAFPLGLLAAARGGAVALLAERAAGLAQTFPSVALLALLVPAVGYGALPALAAVALYCFFPVFRATLSGLAAAPPELVEAARGLGMDEGQILRRVRLPAALPLVLEGLRVALVLAVATATLGAVVGAGGLGVPVVSGLRSLDPILVLQGALPASLLALLADNLLRLAETLLRKR